MPISQKPRKNTRKNATPRRPEKSAWMDSAKREVVGYSRKAYRYQQRNKHVLSDYCTERASIGG